MFDDDKNKKWLKKSNKRLLLLERLWIIAFVLSVLITITVIALKRFNII